MPVDTAHAGAGGRPLPPRAAADPPGTTPRPGDPAASAPTELAPDAAKHLEKARKLAWRSLNRRERTAAELRERLAAKEIEPWAIDQVVDELREQRYVDDAGYAQRFADDRRRLDGWGSERIERRLRELGVEDEAIAPALAEQDPETELDAAVALLEQRFPVAPETRRDRDRALRMLLRKGYALELALEALRCHAGPEALDDA
jgi:regulatory protein